MFVKGSNNQDTCLILLALYNNIITSNTSNKNSLFFGNDKVEVEGHLAF
jgi:hypothetical protein